MNASPAKSGRTRYLRLFPERVAFMLCHLSEREFCAALRLSAAYVVADGDLQDDDRRLAAAANMSPKAWAALRDKLLLLGLARIDKGKWVDDDQAHSLHLQRDYSERQRQRAQKRWHSHAA